MTRVGASTRQYAPIFDWETPSRRKISLFTFVAASAALHAFCFYLFQIVYPLTVALLPPPARVQLITPDSEQGRLLLRWVEAEDPALSSFTQRPPDTQSLLPAEPSHIPSYLGYQPALRQLPPYQPDLSIPSAEPPGPVVLPRRSVPVPVGPVASSLHFANADALGRPETPALKFTASRSEPPEPAQFRIGIDAGGAVRYCLLETSSGDPGLDAQAHRQLLLCRFRRNQNPTGPNDPLRWTTATFHWGNDLSFPSQSQETPGP